MLNWRSSSVNRVLVRCLVVVLAYGFVLSGTPSKTVPQFTDVTASSGVNFQHLSGATVDKRYLFEAKGGGVGFFDFDNDGWQDILIVQGSTNEAFRQGVKQNCGLYRNRGDGSFEDVSEKSGLSSSGWGMGVAFADYDNDSFVDVYLTNLVANVLFKNNGDGTFLDVTSTAGVADSKWSSSAAFGDYDQDGFVDLYVCNYIWMDMDNLPEPGSEPYCHYRGRPGICGPIGMRGSPNTLYRNNGDGTFSDVTRQTGVADATPYFSLGAVWSDFDNDADLDLVAANDSTPNSVFLNQGDGTFVEAGLLTGLAVSVDGRFQASMGVDFADYDNDGLLDFFSTHFANDYSTLYRNVNGMLFEDVSSQAQLVQPEWLLVSWGTRFVDLNHDGWKDLIHANGHIYPFLLEAGWTEKYHQPITFYLNKGDGTFRDVSKEAGQALQQELNGRGMAFADYDNDGDIDCLVANIDGVPRLLRNDIQDSNWVMFRVKGDKGNRDGLGARLTLSAGSVTQIWEIKRSVGVYSSSDPRAHFGLGTAKTIDRLKVKWPSGRTQEFTNLKANTHYQIDESGGISPAN
jgi:hypothetical protein